MATLEKVAHINDLSKKTREELVKRVKGYGRYVKYKFNIERKNPDPEKVNGQFVVPALFSLHPTKIDLFDKNHDGGGRQVTVGLVERTDDKGLPDKYKIIKLLASDRCELSLDTEDVEQMQVAMYLEIHSKNTDSMFPNPSVYPVFSRLDEQKASTDSRTIRSAKVAALNVAMAMSDAEIMEFARAMVWEGCDDLAKVGLFRDAVEKEAEVDPDKFRTLVESKKIQYLASIQSGLEKRKIVYNAGERSFAWMSGGNPVFVCSQGTAKEPNLQFAEWLMTDEGKAKDIFKKIKEVAE